MIYDAATGQWVDEAGAGMPPPAQKSGVLRRYVADPLVAVSKGVVDLGNAAVGLAGIPTMGLPGKAMEAIGDPLHKASAALGNLYSPEMKQAEQDVGAASGFIDSAKAVLSRPGYAATKVAEMAPAMLIPQGLLARTGMGMLKAGMLGEGLVTAGQQSEDIRQQNESGFLTPGQGAIAAGSGAITAAITGLGGKAAAKLGGVDVDTLLLSGMQKGAKNIAARTAGGFAAEAGEEGLQSYQEQAAQNLATGKPLTQGAAEAAGAGAALGGLMGGTLSALNTGKHVNQATEAQRTLEKPVPVLAAEDGTTHPDFTQHEKAIADYADYLRWNGVDPKVVREWRASAQEALNKQNADGSFSLDNGATPAADVMRNVDPISYDDIRTRRETEGEFGEAQTLPAASSYHPNQPSIDAAVAQGTAEANANDAIMAELEAQDAALAAVEAKKAAKAPAVKTPKAPTAKEVKAAVAQQEAAATYAPETPIPDTPTLKARMSAVAREDGKPFSTAAVHSLDKAVRKAFPTGGTVQGLHGFLTKYAADNNAKAPATAELASVYADRLSTQITPQGAPNVQTPPVDQGAKPEPAPSQAPAAVPVDPTQAAAQGDAASQPAEKAPEEVAPPAPAKPKRARRTEAEAKAAKKAKPAAPKAAPEPAPTPAPAAESLYDIPKPAEPTEADWETTIAAAKASLNTLGLKLKDATVPYLRQARAQLNAKIAAAPAGEQAALTNVRTQVADAIVAAENKAKAAKQKVAAATAVLEAPPAAPAPAPKPEISPEEKAKNERVKADAKKALKKEADSDRLKAEYAKNKEDLLDLSDKWDRNGQLLSKVDQATFMELYKKVFKANAKFETFREALNHTQTKLHDKRGVGSTNDALQLALMMANNAKRLPEIIKAISAMAKNPAHKALAERLVALDLSGVTVVYEPVLKAGSSGHAAWKLGNYNSTGGNATITIYAGGENSQVILHEAVHAATVARLQSALAAAKSTQDGRLQNKGHLQLVELYSTLEAMPEFKGEYAFKNLYEFVAEVHTNPGLQAKLKATKLQSTSLWTRFVEAVRNLLGLPSTTTNALEKALLLTDPLFGDKAAAQPADFDSLASPLTAMSEPFQRAGKFVASFDKASAVPNWLSTGSAKLRKAKLYVTSTQYIKDWLMRNKELQPMHGGVKAWSDAQSKKAEVVSMIAKDVFDGFLSRYENALNKTKDAQKMDKRVGLLMGEASRLGLDIAQNFAGNKARNPKLKDHLKDHVNELNADYLRLKQSNPALADLALEGLRVNRKLYTMQMSTLAVSMLKAHQMTNDTKAAATQLFNKWAKELDILQDATGLTNTDPKLHADALASKLHTSLLGLFDDIKNAYPHGAIADDFKSITNYYSAAWANPYMHLGRHGMYSISFKAVDNSAQTVAKLNQLLGQFDKALGPFLGNDTEVFMRANTPYELKQMEAVLRANPSVVKHHVVEGQSAPQPIISAGAISDAKELDNAFGVGKALKGLRTRMRDKYAHMASSTEPGVKEAYNTMIAAMEESLLDMMEVNSARQANQKREGVPGYDTSFKRNFSKRAQWASSTISNQHTSDLYSEAFREMQHRINDMRTQDSQLGVRGQEVHDELATRYSNSLKPNLNPVVHSLSVFGHNYYLALSPAYAIGNLLQPYMLTMPLLGGRFGFVKSAKTLGGASKDIAQIIATAVAAGKKAGGWRGTLDANIDFTGSKLPKGEIKFLEHLLRTGIVDTSQTQELARMSKGESSTAATAAKAMSVFNHYTEVQNRLSAGLAAYRLNAAASETARLEYAVNVIGQTQFDYVEHNKARAIGRHGLFGAMTPLFLQFQNFAFFTMEHYARMAMEGVIDREYVKTHPEEAKAARKAFLGTLLTTATIAGTMGLPFATVLAAIANSGDDDMDARAQYRAWLTEVFGKDMADMVAKGVVSRGALGVDLTGSLGQQDLFPGSRFLADRRKWEDQLKDQSKSMFGPAANAGFDIVGGVVAMREGDVVAGIKQMLPRFLKGPAGAAETAQHGAFVNKSGTTLPMPVTWVDYAKMTAGYTPAAKADQSEANFYYQSELTQRKMDKAKAQRRALRAYDAGDVGEMAAAVAEYNETHPTTPIKSLDSVIKARARGQAAAVASHTGIIDGNSTHLPVLQGYTWAEHN